MGKILENESKRLLRSHGIPTPDNATASNSGEAHRIAEAIVRHKAVYFAAVGGTGALLSQAIRSVEVLAYEELGPEAIRKLVIEEFPCIVINDCFGNDWYEQAVEKYRYPES